MFIKVKIYFSDFSLPWNFTTELSAVAITSMYLGLVLSMSGNIISGSDKVPGRRDKYVTNRNARYAFLEYTKTVDSVFCVLWLATQSVNILHYSPPPPSERRQTRVSCEQNAFPVAAVTNKEISQLIKQAVPEVYEEVDEVRFGSFKR